MSVICLMHEDNHLIGLDCYETDMHCQVGLKKFQPNVLMY